MLLNLAGRPLLWVLLYLFRIWFLVKYTQYYKPGQIQYKQYTKRLIRHSMVWLSLGIGFIFMAADALKVYLSNVRYGHRSSPLPHQMMGFMIYVCFILFLSTLILGLALKREGKVE